MADEHNPTSQECRCDEHSALLEHMRDVVLFVRADDGRIMEANRAAELLYGYRLTELLGMRIYDLVAGRDDRDPVPADAADERDITAEGSLFETVHKRGDGVEISVEVNARVFDFHGERTIIAVVRDISERKESETALRRAYEEMEQVIETAAEGMRVVDTEHNVIRVNNTFLEMTGLAREETVGAKCFESFRGAHCGTEECPLRRVLVGGERLSDEVDKWRPDGGVVACLRTVQPYVVDGEVVGIIESFRDITERKHAERLAEHLATHDTLTALPNRLLFSDRVDVALARARREGTRPALLFCDLDDFKIINDSLGHSVGDDALRSVAAAITSVVREVDTVARFGGDEFVVLLADVAGPEAASAVAEKILKALGKQHVHPGLARGLTASIGVTLYRDGDGIDSFLTRADTAMYQAKAHGGHQYQLLHG